MRIGAAARRAAAQHEPRVDVPDPARARGRAATRRCRACSPSPATRCCSSTRPAGAWSTRSCRTTSWRRRSSSGTPLRGEYPNLVLVQVWDQRSQEHSASDEYGRLIVAAGRDDAHVLRGETLAELARGGARAARARTRRVTGGLRARRRLGGQPARARSPASTSSRATGDDVDFGRGERAVQQLFNGDVQRGAGPHEPDDVAARARAGRTTPRSSPAARWTPRAARRPTPDGQVRRRPGPPDPGPLRRRQLRRLAVGARLLGRRRHARPDHRLRLPRRAGERREAARAPADAARLSGVS